MMAERSESGTMAGFTGRSAIMVTASGVNADLMSLAAKDRARNSHRHSAER